MMRRSYVSLTVVVLACLLMVSVTAFAQEKTAWDYISVFAQGDRGPEWDAQLAATHGLVELGDAAVVPLLSVVKHQNTQTRSQLWVG